VSIYFRQVQKALPTGNIPRPCEEEVAAGDSNAYKLTIPEVSPDDGMVTRKFSDERHIRRLDQ
jgi:hypothetical protein